MICKHCKRPIWFYVKYWLCESENSATCPNARDHAPAAVKVQRFLHLTFAQAEYQHRAGLMSDPEWDAYRAIWQYSAPRFSDIASGSGPLFPRVRDFWAVQL